MFTPIAIPRYRNILSDDKFGSPSSRTLSGVHGTSISNSVTRRWNVIISRSDSNNYLFMFVQYNAILSHILFLYTLRTSPSDSGRTRLRRCCAFGSSCIILCVLGYEHEHSITAAHILLTIIHVEIAVFERIPPDRYLCARERTLYYKFIIIMYIKRCYYFAQHTLPLP